MKKFNRVLSLILAFSMVLSICPGLSLAAFAAETDDYVPTITDTLDEGRTTLTLKASIPESEEGSESGEPDDMINFTVADAVYADDQLTVNVEISNAPIGNAQMVAATFNCVAEGVDLGAPMVTAGTNTTMAAWNDGCVCAMGNSSDFAIMLVHDVTLAAGTYTLSSVNANAGDTVTVTISLENGLSDGFLYGEFQIEYDSENLTLLAGAPGAALEGIATNENGFCCDTVDGYVYIADDSWAENVTVSGEVAVLTFQVSEDAVGGDYEITLTDAWDAGIWFYDADWNDLGIIPTINAGTITVEKGAEKPSITTQPAGALYEVGAAEVTPLSVEASVTEGELSYQWYSNTSAGAVDGTAIEGATDTTYTPDVSKVSVTYYYCEVTNTVTVDGMVKTKSVATDVVEIKVVPEGAADFGACGENLTWTLTANGTDPETYTLSIDGEGAMTDYTYNTRTDTPWNGYSASSITAISIGEGVTSVGAFSFVSYAALTTVVLPGSLTSIGNHIFSDCDLRSLTIPSTVTTLGDCVFYGNKNLGRVTIPDSVASMGMMVFQDCTGLMQATIGSGIITLAQYTFSGCTSLREAVIPAGVTAVANNAFYNCSALSTVYFRGIQEQWNAITISTSNDPLTAAILVWDFTGEMNYPWAVYADQIKAVVIGDGVTVVGQMAFYGCKNLVSVTIADSVTELCSYVFKNCTSMNHVTLPDGLEYINEGAFYGCSALTEIVIPATVTEIADYAFAHCTRMQTVTILGNPTVGENSFKNVPGYNA